MRRNSSAASRSTLSSAGRVARAVTVGNRNRRAASLVTARRGTLRTSGSPPARGSVSQRGADSPPDRRDLSTWSCYLTVLGEHQVVADPALLDGPVLELGDR